MSEILKKNLSYLAQELAKQILSSESSGVLEKTKSNQDNLLVDGIYFHSKHDPGIEAKRLLDGLKKSDEKKVYIFFGAGLGYAILEALKLSNVQVIWMECYPGILKHALSINDYSKYLESGQLKLLVKPFTEDSLFSTFKGISVLPVTFIPHRPSISWKEQDYIECKYICEKFFQKKDVNIATLSRFEKIWTRNLIQNFPEIRNLTPVSRLFGIASSLPIVVSGAGPSLYESLNDLKNYRHCFILIAVDTALHILVGAGIEPDLIFSVDPQALNSSYLEGYSGRGYIVFDPTSSYHTLRLSEVFKSGFFTSSPFPLIQIYTKHLKIEAGDIPFGGSVSTNAVSLAELMGASNVYFVGQDLAFTNGYAHCRGAILEERLNFKESRFFRREKHNYNQLTALPKLKSIGYDGEEYHSNEKMQIFQKWFGDRSENRKWINLSARGAKIKGVPRKTFRESFESIYNDNETIIKIENVKKQIIEEVRKPSSHYFELDSFLTETEKMYSELKMFTATLKKGKELAEKIYSLIQRKGNTAREVNELLVQMNHIDEEVSSKKNLNEVIGMSVQRTILTITEGYETNLSLEEKKNPHLGVAKKSILLYTGLYEGASLIQRLIKKTSMRMSDERNK
jgi:hypothetical protein